MDEMRQKKICAASKYCLCNFSDEIWFSLRYFLGRKPSQRKMKLLANSLEAGAPDFPILLYQVIYDACEKDCKLIDQIINYFDIDLWYQKKYPEKYSIVFKIHQTESSERLQGFSSESLFWDNSFQPTNRQNHAKHDPDEPLLSGNHGQPEISSGT